mmetsp:Transcript_523/g.1521  ORF Transcript_523/g.1521 Transcript_523/m.1521 type:complete len:309 (-) Transcript_523:4347-5273(-)
MPETEPLLRDAVGVAPPQTGPLCAGKLGEHALAAALHRWPQLRAPGQVSGATSREGCRQPRWVQMRVRALRALVAGAASRGETHRPCGHQAPPLKSSASQQSAPESPGQSQLLRIARAEVRRAVPAVAADRRRGGPQERLRRHHAAWLAYALEVPSALCSPRETLGSRRHPMHASVVRSHRPESAQPGCCAAFSCGGRLEIHASLEIHATCARDWWHRPPCRALVAVPVRASVAVLVRASVVAAAWLAVGSSARWRRHVSVADRSLHSCPSSGPFAVLQNRANVANGPSLMQAAAAAANRCRQSDAGS